MAEATSLPTLLILEAPLNGRAILQDNDQGAWMAEATSLPTLLILEAPLKRTSNPSGL